MGREKPLLLRFFVFLKKFQEIFKNLKHFAIKKRLII